MDPSHERILVVDDEAQLRRMFERILRTEGYEVRCASSGNEALKLLETEWFDLVVTDLKMPGMDGMELLAKGKSANPTLPFIVLTAFGTVRSAVAAVQEGAYDYLVKPFDIEELQLVIKKALELHRLKREELDFDLS
jgi:DNA-binding NtrC family response regulator